MKKTALIILTILSTSKVFAQPGMVNFYFITAIQFENINYKFGPVDNAPTLTGKTRDILMRGDAMVGGMVVHADVTYLTATLLAGFKAPKKSIDGGVFECGVGTTFAGKDKSIWGWSADLRFRQIISDPIHADSATSIGTQNHGYIGVGGSLYYLRTIANVVNVRPKFGFAYGGFTQGANGRCWYFDFAVAVGVPIYNGFGLSVTAGAYKIAVKDVVEINPRYIQIGITRCF